MLIYSFYTYHMLFYCAVRVLRFLVYAGAVWSRRLQMERFRTPSHMELTLL